MGERLNLEFQSNGRVLANAYYHWSGYTTIAVGLATKAVNAWNELEGVLPFETISAQIIRAVLALSSTGSGIPEAEITQSLKYLSERYIEDVKAGEITLYQQEPLLQSRVALPENIEVINKDCENSSIEESTLAEKFIEKIRPMIKKCEGRNEGITGCLQDDIKKTQYWAEETVIIDVTSKKVDIRRAFLRYASLKEMASDYNYEVVNGKLIDDNNNIITIDTFPYDVLVDFKDIDKISKYLNANEGNSFEYKGEIYDYVY